MVLSEVAYAQTPKPGMHFVYGSNTIVASSLWIPPGLKDMAAIV
jgi:hypothetical protein